MSRTRIEAKRNATRMFYRNLLELSRSDSHLNLATFFKLAEAESEWFLQDNPLIKNPKWPSLKETNERSN